MLVYSLAYNLILWGIVGLALLTPYPYEVGAGAFGFLLGIALGSGLHQALSRWWQGAPLFEKASFCPGCQRPILKRHNIPLLGWLVLRGRCASCGFRIPWHYPAVELAAGLGCAALAVMLISG